jgi:CRP-like cAMP-binding protein
VLLRSRWHAAGRHLHNQTVWPVAAALRTRQPARFRRQSRPRYDYWSVGGATVSPFVQKLAHGAHLLNEDRAVLAQLAEPVRRVERGDILLKGLTPHCITVVLEGWIYRYKQLENGKRQITSVFVPGDMCEPFGALPGLRGYTLRASTPGLLGCIAPQALRKAARASSRIEQALWWDLLVSDAMDREQIVSLGRRSATERLAHFFCEMHVRLGMVGLADQSSYELPLTQADMADMLGLSPVHVNRSLQDLRGSGLLSFQGRHATIHDLNGLRTLAMFDPALYSAARQGLHLSFTP